jgi:hypothetical protein
MCRSPQGAYRSAEETGIVAGQLQSNRAALASLAVKQYYLTGVS